MTARWGAEVLAVAVLVPGDHDHMNAMVGDLDARHDLQIQSSVGGVDGSSQRLAQTGVGRRTGGNLDALVLSERSSRDAST